MPPRPELTPRRGRRPSALISSIQLIPQLFDKLNPEPSSLKLLYALLPDWQREEGPIEFVRFTDGITNTLLKATKRRPNRSAAEVEDDTVLLRAYGNHTDVLIDREREMRVHLLLCSHELAPSLLARFQNGLIYRYLRGSTPSHKDFDQTPLWKGIARKLGEWHAVLSASGLSYAHSTARQADQAKRNSMHSKAGSTNGTAQNGTPVNGYTPTNEDSTRPNPDLETKIRGQTYDAALMRIRESQGAEALEPDLWSVTLQWIFALPNGSEAARARQERLLDELLWAVKTLMRKPAKNGTETVVCHCDLLSANVIIEDPPQKAVPADQHPVSFIDYEYATPGPAAFDLSNHFAEWVGYECDYTLIPTRRQRQDFIREYLEARRAHSTDEHGGAAPHADSVEAFSNSVDEFRGIPGLYWGIWALIQAQISEIDFDYASYAELRLKEYWDWKDSLQAEPKEKGELSVREARWRQDG